MKRRKYQKCLLISMYSMKIGRFLGSNEANYDSFQQPRRGYAKYTMLFAAGAMFAPVMTIEYDNSLYVCKCEGAITPRKFAQSNVWSYLSLERLCTWHRYLDKHRSRWLLAVICAV